MQASTLILQLISASDQRLTADAVVRHLSCKGRYTRRELRAAIRKLVESGELCYSYELGCSFLEPSFNRPIQVTRRIVLAPPGHRVRPNPPAVTVRLAPGAAFGYGQHPTTRMALDAVDAALEGNPGLVRASRNGILDLGTGSGVLIITAVLLGMPGGLGVDIDPCALAEAKRNVALNGLQHKIRIKDIPFDSQAERFSMITANLRLPTLVKYSVPIAGSVAPRGALIVSGIKTEELTVIEKTYADAGLGKMRTWNEKGWAAILMQKQ